MAAVKAALDVVAKAVEIEHLRATAEFQQVSAADGKAPFPDASHGCHARVGAMDSPRGQAHP